MFYGQQEEKPCPPNSALKASELLCQEYIEYWSYVIYIN